MQKSFLPCCIMDSCSAFASRIHCVFSRLRVVDSGQVTFKETLPSSDDENDILNPAQMVSIIANVQRLVPMPRSPVGCCLP